MSISSPDNQTETIDHSNFHQWEGKSVNKALVPDNSHPSPPLESTSGSARDLDHFTGNQDSNSKPQGDFAESNSTGQAPSHSTNQVSVPAVDGSAKPQPSHTPDNHLSASQAFGVSPSGMPTAYHSTPTLTFAQDPYSGHQLWLGQKGTGHAVDYIPKSLPMNGQDIGGSAPLYNAGGAPPRNRTSTRAVGAGMAASPMTNIGAPYDLPQNYLAPPVVAGTNIGTDQTSYLMGGYAPMAHGGGDGAPPTNLPHMPTDGDATAAAAAAGMAPSYVTGNPMSYPQMMVPQQAGSYYPQSSGPYRDAPRLMSNPAGQDGSQKHAVNSQSPYMMDAANTYAASGQAYPADARDGSHQLGHRLLISGEGPLGPRGISNGGALPIAQPVGGHSASNSGDWGRGKQSITASASPVSVETDAQGVTWVRFEYTRNRVKWMYKIRCDIQNVQEENFSEEFMVENCIYPKAMVPPEQYTGHRQRYETECNQIGWRLSYLNPELQTKRGLIQRAVDSYRNSSGDQSIRSRRVRRLDRMRVPPRRF